MNKEEAHTLSELAKATKLLDEATYILREAQDVFGDADEQSLAEYASVLEKVRRTIISRILKELSER